MLQPRCDSAFSVQTVNALLPRVICQTIMYFVSDPLVSVSSARSYLTPLSLRLSLSSSLSLSPYLRQASSLPLPCPHRTHRISLLYIIPDTDAPKPNGTTPFCRQESSSSGDKQSIVAATIHRPRNISTSRATPADPSNATVAASLTICFSCPAPVECPPVRLTSARGSINAEPTEAPGFNCDSVPAWRSERLA